MTETSPTRPPAGRSAVLRQFLLMAGLVVTVSGLLVAGLIRDALDARTAALDQAVATSAHRTDVLGEHIGALVTAVDMLMLDVADMVRFRVFSDTYSPMLFEDALRRKVLNLPFVVAVSVFGQDGGRESNSSGGRIGRASLAASETLHDHRDRRIGLRIGPPQRVSGHPAPVLIGSRRIDGLGGQFLGIVVVYIDAQALSEAMRGAELLPNGEVWLLDPHGTPLSALRRVGARRADAVDLAAVPSSLAARFPEATAQPGVARFQRVADDYAISSRQLTGFPLRVVQITDLASLRQEWRQTVLVSRVTLVVAILALIGLLLAVLFGLARRRARAERSLAESEERFRQFADTADIVFWVRTADRMLFVSDAYERIFGLPVSSLYERPDSFVETVVAADRERVLAAFAKEMTQSGSFDEEYRIHGPRGELRWIHARSFGIRDARGRIARSTGIAQDITDRKRTALELEASRQRLQEVQTIARLGHWEADLATGALWWSDMVYEIFGLQPQRFAPTVAAFYDRVHPEDVAKVRRSQRQSESTGLHDVEHRIVRPDGTVRWVREVARMDTDVTGAPMRLLGTVQDITAAKQAQAEIEALARRNALILNSVGEGIYGIDPGGYITFINDAALAMLGFEREELLAENAHKAFHHQRPDGSQYPVEMCPIHQVLLDGKPRRSDDDLFWRKDGGALPVDFLATPIHGRDGAVQGAVTTFRDITERQDMERGLRRAEAVFTHSPEGIMVTDADNLIVTVNPAFTAITGFAADQVIGRNPSMLSAGELEGSVYRRMWRTLEEVGHWQGEMRNRKADGTIYPQWLSIVRMVDPGGATSGYIALLSDITERKAQEDHILYKANYDQLTGLPNRSLFRERLKQELSRAHRLGAQVGLLFLDLDHFKDVNDTLGHAAGDTLLCQAADRLRAALRKSDTVARMGGDEFTVILPDLHRREEVMRIANKLIAAMAEPFTVAGQINFLGASVGITVYPDDGDTVEVLLRQADAAMYLAKSQGRGRSAVFDEALNQEMRDRTALANDLRQALAADGLHLHFQPQIEVATGAVVGLEALARWHHPGRGPVGPDRFIPIAEEANLIHELGDWVVRTACRQILAWRQDGLVVPPVAVNVSPHQVRVRGFADRIHDIVVGGRLVPADLVLDIAERVVIGDSPDVLASFDLLRRRGFALAIDDFGGGYSSLASLHRFSAQFLKIDRSVIQGLSDDPDSRVLVQTIIAMGQALGLKVVAMGVETPAQRRFLAERKCDHLQGFIASPAVPADEVAGYLRDPARLGLAI